MSDEPFDILVIDDVRTFSFPNAVYARTLEEGRRLLYSQPWAVVWLDHDLGVGPDGKWTDIRPLIAEVEEDAYNGKLLPIEDFVIHTDSPSGAVWIARALRGYYRTIRVDSAKYVSK